MRDSLYYSITINCFQRSNIISIYWLYEIGFTSHSIILNPRNWVAGQGFLYRVTVRPDDGGVITKLRTEVT